MIIVVGEWKRKVARLVLLVMIVGGFAAAVPAVTGKLHQRVPVSGWFKDEHPSGNPMRVEKNDKKSAGQSADKTGFDKRMDQFVIKLQDFYYEE